MDKLLHDIADIVGEQNLLTGGDVSARSDSWPAAGGCQARAIVRPADTAQVAAVMKLCHAARQPVITHGGLTGLVGGAKTGRDDLVVSLERMREIAPVDRLNRTLTVGAGAVLQTVHEAAEQADLMFALDFGARGSATVGGAISTNAGGNSVIRYGMTREQVLGLEAVLADGTVISSMNSVLKNNTGYDLKQLFIGSEGTLGIVTRAVLRLRPLMPSRNTALVAVADFDALPRFLRAMDAALGGTLSAFEVMWNDFYRLIIGDGSRHGRPLDDEHPFYVLVEAAGSSEDIDRLRFEKALEEALGQELIVDATLAQNRQQRAALWAIRDDIETMARALYPPVTFDVSLSIPDMKAYVDAVRARLMQRWPDARMATFGHLGDGNIHLVFTIGSLEPAQVSALDEIVYGELAPMRGVISAEHGIGLTKREFLSVSRSATEIALMKTLKRALDPAGILNPGKIFSIDEGEAS